MEEKTTFRNICQHCGREFTVYTSVTTYCSTRCTKLADKLKKRNERLRETQADVLEMQRLALLDKNYLTLSDAARLNDKRLPGTPDLVLPKYRAVIFINGCFWHGHRGCTKYTVPKTNEQFWREKVARNIARDELNAQRLDTLAWTVITVWDCELSKKNLDATITRIEADLQAAKTKYERYLSIRRENREFARKQAQKHREILAQVEAELNLPKSLRRYATKAVDEE